MQIYVNKNNQQLGPFDDLTVVEMLKNGQLSANDFAIKEGEQQWQPLGNLFPTTSAASAVPNQILPDSIPAKKGFGCLRLFGIALVFLAVVTLIGGLANYRIEILTIIVASKPSPKSEKLTKRLPNFRREPKMPLQKTV